MQTTNHAPDNATAINLPDDPRDCCREALDIMGDDFEDAETLVQDVLAVSWSSLAKDTDYSRERLRNMIDRGERAMGRLSHDLDRVRALVRHGTTDCREIDAEQEEIRRAREEGRQPPYPAKLMTRVLELEEKRRRQREQQEGDNPDTAA